MRGRVLVVDDLEPDRVLAEELLTEAGFEVHLASSGDQALELVSTTLPDVVVTDVRMPGVDGVELCTRLAEQYPEIPTILVTGLQETEVVVEALRAGAFDFFFKPLEREIVVAAVDRAVERGTLRHEVELLRARLAESQVGFPGVIGDSAPMQEVLALLERAAVADISVLLQGETGTGKEVLARSLHQRSARREGPFLALNCAAIPPQRLEAELFGPEEGALTDASSPRGLFQRADGGTLLLDEVGDLPLEVQGRLLRALQAPKVGSGPRGFDVRVVSTTHRDLRAEVAAGRFRQDLFFRLNVMQVALPPLRERGQDILLLAQSFLEAFAPSLPQPVTRFSAEVAGALLAYRWPGNVRELENCVQRAAAVATPEVVELRDLPDELRAAPPPASRPAGGQSLESLKQVEARHIAFVLAATKGNKVQCAKVLGVDRTTLYRKIDKYGITLD